jgi:hypothetical protein
MLIIILNAVRIVANLAMLNINWKLQIAREPQLFTAFYRLVLFFKR